MSSPSTGLPRSPCSKKSQRLESSAVSSRLRTFEHRMFGTWYPPQRTASGASQYSRSQRVLAHHGSPGCLPGDSSAWRCAHAMFRIGALESTWPSRTQPAPTYWSICNRAPVEANFTRSSSADPDQGKRSVSSDHSEQHHPVRPRPHAGVHAPLAAERAPWPFDSCGGYPRVVGVGPPRACERGSP